MDVYEFGEADLGEVVERARRAVGAPASTPPR